MPSINEVIERVNRSRPDAIDDETKAAWLLELDGSATLTGDLTGDGVINGMDLALLRYKLLNTANDTEKG